MLKKLENSGLPIYMDTDTQLLSLEVPLTYDSYGRKVVREMDGLLRSPAISDLEEPYYDVYRGIRYAKDKELLDRSDYRYDITIIMPGLIDGECKKTSGHYHGYNPAHTNTYPEVYEVIKGTAVYILQRSDNFEGDPEHLQIDDLIVVRVEEGQTIIIPPNYGHCSINAGDGPLVFSNLAYVPCPIEYGPVKHYTGMSCYLIKENTELRTVPNPCYKNVPVPRFAKVKENPHLGIKFGLPVYQSYVASPSAFHFLGNVDGYESEIFSMLEFE